MTTNKDLLKPEHGTVQAQDVHEIEKESETDSAEKAEFISSCSYSCADYQDYS